MEIKQLEYFLQICQDGSFSKAADNLYLTQQGLSKAIKKFEEELEILLFYRTTSGIKLTEYGEYLKEKAQHIIDESKQIANEIKRMKNTKKGELRIAFSFGVISALSPDFIANFEQAYPNIDLQIKEYQDFFCEKAVFNEEAELGFTIAPVDSKLFDFFTVKKDKMCLLVNKQNPLSRKQTVDFVELKNEKFITVNENFKLYHNFVDRCRADGFEPDIYFTTKEMILIQKLSQSNKGIGVSVDFISHEIPNVEAVSFNDSSCSWEVCLICKKGQSSPLTEIFINYTLNNGVL